MYKNVNIYNKRNGKYMKKRIIAVVLIIEIIQSFGTVSYTHLASLDCYANPCNMGRYIYRLWAI